MLPGDNEKNANGEQKKQLEESRLKVQKRLNRIYQRRSVLQCGLPTRERAAKDRDYLESVPVVKSLEWKQDGEKLYAQVTRRHETIDFDASGKGGYSVEKGLFGGAELSFNWTLEEYRETQLEFGATRGQDVREASVAFKFQKINPMQRFHYGFSVSAINKRVLDQLLGSEQDAFGEGKLQGAARWTFDYDSFEFDDRIRSVTGFVKRSRLRYKTRNSIAFEVEDTSLDPMEMSSVQALGGQIDSWALSSDQGLSFDLRQEGRRVPLDALDLRLHLEGEKGVDFVGGEYLYDQYLLSLMGELSFGGESTRDYFVRYTIGAGVSSASTPIFKQFRLGGPDSLRGMENGERVGRGIFWEQVDLGIHLPALWRLIKPNRAPVTDESETEVAEAIESIENIETSETSTSENTEETEDAESKKNGSFGQQLQQLLSKAYLKVFFDRGTTTDSSSLSEIARSRRDAKGFGLAIEFGIGNVGGRLAKLSIGCAKSPDSTAHGSGLFFTAISLGI
jgi:hypothetical protein